MNDDNMSWVDEMPLECIDSPPLAHISPPGIPAYLQETYWWAYLHPRSLWWFEREWVVNLILWGNMRRLTEVVLAEVSPADQGPALQLACVYGDFSRRLATHLSGQGLRLSLVDVAPIQLRNARRKLADCANVSLHLQDSSELQFPSASFSHTVVFFLLHEQPESVRRRTLAEAVRVTRPGGKVIIVDYHKPHRANPLRYLMRPVLKTLEPFALDLWRHKLASFLPDGIGSSQLETRSYCAGLYQKVVITC